LRLFNWFIDRILDRAVDREFPIPKHPRALRKGVKTILHIGVHRKSGEYMIEFGGNQKDVLGIVPLIDIVRNRIYEDTDLMLNGANVPKKDTRYVG
jgi:hypothetical protein